ncbi:MAG: metallophosphoesterase [Spirosoma sp.]|nr:metallophosphoesterase [Spirosoma sp.]
MRGFLYLFLFGLMLAGSTALAQNLVRGPYLQVITPTSVTVRWRTNQPVIGRVWSGPSDTQLTNSLREGQASLEHSVTLTGLQPATRYAYAIGHDEIKLAAGPDYYVQTAPTTGDKRPMRMWVLGDFGVGNENQQAVYQAYRKATANRPADLWLWLGDNAYCCGTDEEYQQYVFNVYGPTFRNTPFYPSPGNHDYADSGTNFNIPYYKLFSMPTKAEAGGVASNSQAYFSANYGNVHIISLDSQAQQPQDQGRLYDTTSVQVQWLKQDLAANKLTWTIVIFHHPPYSKGSHDSDTEEQMRLLREKLTPILERYGVDLVLNGHSHGYERYYRLKGQTGLSGTFDKTKHIAENTTARYDGSPNSCPVLTKGQGTVYVVNGSGGALAGVSPGYPHPGMVAGYRGDIGGGSMLLDVTENRLDAQFIANDGSVQDKFTLMKQVNLKNLQRINRGESVNLQASWPGQYVWNTGQTSRTLTVSPSTSTTYTVQDSQGCLIDEFAVDVTLVTEANNPFDGKVNVYPNPTSGQIFVNVALPMPNDISLSVADSRGVMLVKKQYQKTAALNEEISLPTPGQYIVTIKVGDQLISRKTVRH